MCIIAYKLSVTAIRCITKMCPVSVLMINAQWRFTTSCYLPGAWPVKLAWINIYALEGKREHAVIFLVHDQLGLHGGHL